MHPGQKDAFPFEYEKFRDLVHFIVSQADPRQLGKTKLNKTAWYSDIWAYIKHGWPMTGETYVKDKFGPVPSHIDEALSDLEQAGKIEVRSVDCYGRDKWEYKAIREPNLSRFTLEEIVAIKGFTRIICRKHTAQSISELTHDETWKLAVRGEAIPYCTVLLGTREELTKDDLEWAHHAIVESMGA